MDGGSEFILFEAPFLLNHGARDDAGVSPLVVVSLADDCIFTQPRVNSWPRNTSKPNLNQTLISQIMFNMNLCDGNHSIEGTLPP